MSKVFGIAMMAVALYIAMTLHTEGMEKAFGGVFAPIESARSDSLSASALSPTAESAEQPSSGPQQPVRVTDRFRNRVTSHMELGSERRGY